MARGDALDIVAQDQRVWSTTANALKRSVDNARKTTLGLTILGAFLATAAAQADGDTARALGYSAAAALALAGVIRQWRLGNERVQAWILARTGSEALKRELYLCRTAAGVYASGNPAETLMRRRDEIVQKMSIVQRYREQAARVEPPSPVLTSDEYLEERIYGPTNGQVPFYDERSRLYAKAQARLNFVEFLLAMCGALLGVFVTSSGQKSYGAWVAVITTVSGAIAAHSIAQRYDQMIVSYRAAADRLAGIVGHWRAGGGNNLADLVERCESAILAENQGWIAAGNETNDSARLNGQAGEKPQTALARPAPTV